MRIMSYLSKRAVGVNQFSAFVLASGIAIGAITLQVSPAVAQGAKAGADHSAECNAYVNRLRDKIASYWDLADGKNLVTLTTKVNDDGTNESVSLSSSPNNPQAEQSANAAFVKALPLEPIPKGLGKAATLKIEFDSNSSAHGDSDSQMRVWLNPFKG